MVEAICAMFICSIASALLFESYNLFIRSKQNTIGIMNDNKKCIYSIEHEISDEVTFKDMMELFNNFGDNIVLCTDNSILNKLPNEDFFNILTNEAKKNDNLENNADYLKDVKNIIIYIEKLYISDDSMKIKIVIENKEERKEEITYKSSWLDEM